MFLISRKFLFLGIWTVILPYLGFPKFWKNLLFVVTGVTVAYLAYRLNKEMIRFSKNARKEGKVARADSSKSFIENKEEVIES